MLNKLPHLPLVGAAVVLGLAVLMPLGAGVGHIPSASAADMSFVPGEAALAEKARRDFILDYVRNQFTLVPPDFVYEHIAETPKTFTNISAPVIDLKTLQRDPAGHYHVEFTITSYQLEPGQPIKKPGKFFQKMEFALSEDSSRGDIDNPLGVRAESVVLFSPQNGVWKPLILVPAPQKTN